jgi:flagellar hook-basal body complex protein FliE
MSIGAFDALNAYGRAVRPTLTATATPTIAPSGEVSNFGNVLAEAVSGANSSLNAAESASVRQIAGKGDLIDVTTAMTAAEMAMDTVVAVRDRVISAYSDIMRMQI